MKRIAAIIIAIGFVTVSLTRAAEPVGPKRNILFFSKSSGFEHSTIKVTNGQPSFVEKVLAELGPQHNFVFTFTKDGTVFTPENMAKYDAFFFHTTGDLTTAGNDGTPPMTKEGKAAFLEAIHNGKGFIGTHCATDTFHSHGNEVDPYIAMIGGEFISHGAQQNVKMTCADPKFPGMKEVKDGFEMMEEWYSLKNFADNLHVLLVQQNEGVKGWMYERAPYPATWARMHGKGRVFYTSMGHREDVWTSPIFQRVLVGGINWAVGNVKADATPNLKQAAPQANVLPTPPPPKPKTEEKK